METIGFITLIYLVIGLFFSILVLGYILISDMKAQWKRNDLLLTLPIGILTAMICWLPVVLLILYALVVLWWKFSCKKI